MSRNVQPLSPFSRTNDYEKNEGSNASASLWIARRHGLLQNICDSKGIILIGDAAQAHGAAMGEKKVGNLATMECFSFYPTKI